MNRPHASAKLVRMSEVTHLLEAAAAGDRRAAADLLPLVYDELRKPATVPMPAESPDHTLQPTPLVHEAYLRLLGATPRADFATAGTSSPPRPRPSRPSRSCSRAPRTRFIAGYRPSHKKDAAGGGGGRLRAWFKRTGVA
jgi:hypothetical protein